ncbi:MAG: hypothetical protein GWP14_07155 [Actinobacteria bacterium]|nr:hypothetical protein [Actinomycetota bacterium]
MGHLRNMLLARTGSGARTKAQLVWGKIRRAYLGALRSGYVKDQVQLREGECLRCGTCCKLLYVCPHLEELPDGTTQCKIHHDRPINCRIFPVNASDLRDRDLIGGNGDYKECGFFFTGHNSRKDPRHIGRGH